jgi:hypothetical protein
MVRAEVLPLVRDGGESNLSLYVSLDYLSMSPRDANRRNKPGAPRPQTLRAARLGGCTHGRERRTRFCAPRACRVLDALNRAQKTRSSTGWVDFFLLKTKCASSQASKPHARAQVTGLLRWTSKASSYRSACTRYASFCSPVWVSCWGIALGPSEP